METYFVYFVSNKSRRLYVGITSQLELRVFQHKHKLFDNSFTARYCFDMLIHFEQFSEVYRALDREKELKGWRREKKLRLILAANPDWADLSAEWREDESWKTLPDATYRPELRRRSSSYNPQEQIPPGCSRAEKRSRA